MRKIIFLATAVALAMPAQAWLFKKKKKEEPKPAPVTVVVEEKQPDITGVLDGEWTIRTVGSTQITAEENAPYIYFVMAQDAFYASNGCNILNGVFTVSDGYRITFHNVLSTMKYCKDTPYDTEINVVLADENTVSAKVQNVAGETYMYLSDNTGRQLMVLRRHALDFLNGKWRVADIDGREYDNDEMNIFFDINERKIHGNTGCNYFNGNIFIDPNEAGSISLSGMGVTSRACPDSEPERKMLVALEQATTVVRINDDTVMLTAKEGNGSTIKLVRTKPTATADSDNE